MQKHTVQMINHGLLNRVIRDIDLAAVFQGSPARRYAIVNKALKQGALIRLSRGYYTLAPEQQSHPLSQYHLANSLAWYRIVM